MLIEIVRRQAHRRNPNPRYTAAWHAWNLGFIETALPTYRGIFIWLPMAGIAGALLGWALA